MCMFEQGKIKSYDAEAGFGWIEVLGKSNDVLFQLSDLPHPDILPEEGEELRFRKTLTQGKIKIDQVTRLNFRNLETDSVSPNQSKGLDLTKIIVLIIFTLVGVAAVFGFNTYQNHKIQKQQQVDLLIQEQQKIIAEQRAVVDEQEAAASALTEAEIFKNPGTEFNNYQNKD